MYKINTLQNNERMSTQDLLQAINAAIEAGETDFSGRENAKVYRDQSGTARRLHVPGKH